MSVYYFAVNSDIGIIPTLIIFALIIIGVISFIVFVIRRIIASFRVREGFEPHTAIDKIEGICPHIPDLTNYLSRDNVDAKYLPKDDVAADYMPKSDLDKFYVTKTDVNKFYTINSKIVDKTFREYPYKTFNSSDATGTTALSNIKTTANDSMACQKICATADKCEGYEYYPNRDCRIYPTVDKLYDTDDKIIAGSYKYMDYNPTYKTEPQTDFFAQTDLKWTPQGCQSACSAIPECQSAVFNTVTNQCNLKNVSDDANKRVDNFNTAYVKMV